MTIDLSNEYIQGLIKSYRNALKRYWAECGDTTKNIEESSDYNMAISMMHDAISYQDHLMKTKILYEKYNESKKEIHQH